MPPSPGSQPCLPQSSLACQALRDPVVFGRWAEAVRQQMLKALQNRQGSG